MDRRRKKIVDEVGEHSDDGKDEKICKRGTGLTDDGDMKNGMKIIMQIYDLFRRISTFWQRLCKCS
jgi:hypothetical protein